jgi:uncharacterized zinc-type alcohol dehydrogenase-like protein
MAKSNGSLSKQSHNASSKKAATRVARGTAKFGPVTTRAWGVLDATGPFKALPLERRAPRPDDVLIAIDYCGICHSDIHTARGEWGPTHYPCVPGHEIIGRVLAVGPKVRRFRPGDAVGVGCMVDSCGMCTSCKSDEEQFCADHTVWTYNSTELDGVNQTAGGYSQHITVRQDFVLRLPVSRPAQQRSQALDLKLAGAAPLLCAGITTYSPLKRLKTRRGHRVGVVGLGGLGHMAVKIAKAMGAEVTVISTSEAKRKDAKRLGAKGFVVSTDEGQMASVAGRLDHIIDTVSADHDIAKLMGTLKVGGTLVLVGLPPGPVAVPPFALVGGRKAVAGSLIGGIRETQEMLNFCFKRKVFSDVEMISPDAIAEAYDRTVKGQVRYRFVLDLRNPS